MYQSMLCDKKLERAFCGVSLDKVIGALVYIIYF